MNNLKYLLKYNNLSIFSVAKIINFSPEEVYDTVNNDLDNDCLRAILNAINIPYSVFKKSKTKCNETTNYQKFLKVLKTLLLNYNKKGNQNLNLTKLKKDHDLSKHDPKYPLKKVVARVIYYYQDEELCQFCKRNFWSYQSMLYHIRQFKQTHNGQITQADINQLMEQYIDEKLKKAHQPNYKHQSLEQFMLKHNMDYSLIPAYIKNKEYIDDYDYNYQILPQYIWNYCQKYSLDYEQLTNRYNNIQKLIPDLNYGILEHITTIYDYKTVLIIIKQYNIETQKQLLDTINELSPKEIYDLGQEKVKVKKI